MANRETEVKVEVESTAHLADLEGLPGVEQVRGRPTVLLESTYYDSPGLRLARAHMTLRRRTDGDTARWTLKLPGQKGAERFEVTAGDAEAPDDVPPELRRTLVAQRGVAELQPVALLRNARTTYKLLGGADQVLAEVADDRVTGRLLPEGDEVTWREVEVELVDGDQDLLEAARGQLMTIPGARGASPGKLFRTLGGEPPDAGAVGPTSIDDPAAALVQARLRQQVDEMRRWDPLVREKLPGGVHQMRKAARRLRDGLATSRPFLERAEVESLRDALEWLSHELGDARDAEVLVERLRHALDDVDGAADQSLRTLRRASAIALVAAVEALENERYLHLLQRLDDLVASPPWRSKADKRIAKAYLPRVKHEWTRVSKRVAAASEIPDPTTRADALHECRKAVKRLRYAIEPLVPIAGKPAKRSLHDAKELQSLLGEHHDAVVGRRTAQQLADTAPTHEESSALVAVADLEASRLADLEKDFAARWKRAKLKKRRRWHR
jgi:CHAD domain-containing protein